MLLLDQKMHAATLPARPHCSVSRLQRRGQPVANAAQDYRLELPSAAHALLAVAAKNENTNFLAPTHDFRIFLLLKLSLGHP